MPQESPAIISVRQRLKNTADALHVTLNDTLRLYFLEGFLRRLALSPYHQQFVLGGAFFLYKVALGPTQARLTQDTDFTLQGLPNEDVALRSILQAIVTISASDEITYDPDSILVAPIMLGNPQIGLQSRITGYLGKARDTITLDCSFGSIVPPGPQLRDIPLILPGSPPLSLWTIPLEGIMAGKVESMLRRGTANTRYKDYWDIAQLATSQNFNGDALTTALQATCAEHGTAFTMSSAVFSSSDFLADPGQEANWARFLAQMSHFSHSVLSFAEAIQLVRDLYGPVISDAAHGKTWSHLSRQWQ